MIRLCTLASIYATTATLALAAAAVEPRPELLVSTDWLALHAADADLVVLHVAANRAVYDVGHIPGARFLSLNQLAVTRDGISSQLPRLRDLRKLFRAAGVSDSSRIVLYSEPTILPAARAFFTLDYLGHGSQTALLDGGLPKWLEEGRSVSRDEAPPASRGTFTTRPQPQVVVPAEAVKRPFFRDPTDLLLDARAPEDFRGAPSSVHIPSAVNVFWMENQVSRDNQSLKSPEALYRMYDSLGAPRAKRIIAYCTNGMQASLTYFTLKYLGLDPRLYDGSLSEWRARGYRVEH